MFSRRNDENRSNAIRALKTAARMLFEARDDDVVVVNELQCSEPGCPPIETVVALLRAGCEPHQVKIHKPVTQVTESDLRDALAGCHVHPPSQ